MLIDRVLIGLGSAVIAGGSVLGFLGFTERAQTAAASSVESPVVRAMGPIPLSDDPGDDGPSPEPTDPEDAAEDAAAAAEAKAEEAQRAAEEQAKEAEKAADQRDAQRKEAEQKDAQKKDPGDKAPKPAADGNVDVQALRETYSFGPYGTSNDMDVYRPQGTEPGERLPTVVLVHGGSWVSSSKEVWNSDVAPFLQAGYTTVAVNYRLAGEAAWPAQRTDVVAAVTELRDHADVYNVDPDRIVLLGSSAGAQIAAAAATWDGAAGLVRGFVSMSGPLDLFQIAAATDNPKDAELAQRVTEKLIRCTPAECPDRYEDATPKNQLDPDDVPSLLVAAESDWVDPQGARDFADASNDLGVPSDLVMLPGAKHGMALWPAARSHAMDWIAARMKD
jgi:acetyl esterase/lipase